MHDPPIQPLLDQGDALAVFCQVHRQRLAGFAAAEDQGVEMFGFRHRFYPSSLPYERNPDQRTECV